MNIDLIGLFRVGTNYTRTILESNYEVNVWYDKLGWKHGIISDSVDHTKSNLVTVIKDPYACLDSWFEYTKTPQKNIITKAKSFKEFLYTPIVFSDGQKKNSPQYYFSNPIQMWNSVLWNHINVSKNTNGRILKYEDLLENPEEECKKIENHFNLKKKHEKLIIPNKVARNMNDRKKRNKEEDYLQNKSFDKTKYFLNREYMEKFSFRDKQFIEKELSNELMTKFYDYAELNYKIYTIGYKDDLIGLRRLLESNALHDNVEVRVIPFDSDTESIKLLCKEFNATLVKINNLWDRLGESIYREKLDDTPFLKKSFRKLNCFNSKDENFVFLDSGLLISSSLKEVVMKLSSYDFIFRNKLKKSEMFPPWSETLLNISCNDLDKGFDTSVFVGNSSAFNNINLNILTRKPNIRKMLLPTLYDGFFNLLVAISHKDVSFFDSCVGDIAIVSEGNARTLEIEKLD